MQTVCSVKGLIDQVQQLNLKNSMRWLVIPESPNECWSADFMSYALRSHRCFRTFNVMDDFNREALRIEIDTSACQTYRAGAG